MLSTNQKAKMINKRLSELHEAVELPKEINLTTIDFMSIHKNKIDISIDKIKSFYGIDANKSLLILPGFYIIHPVQFDEQIDIKFNNLNLKED